MASNCIIFGPSFLLYSLILVLTYFCEPSSIFYLIRSITHLITIHNEQPPKDYTFSVIYPYVMKGAFVYSIFVLFFSTNMTFSSYSSYRELPAAITRHWKPFFASIVAAIFFPAILRPPSMADPLFGTYFTVTLIHALFVVYFWVKLVTIPMLKEKCRIDVEVLKNSSRRKFIFWQILISIMEIVKLYLSKEAYKMQVVFGIVAAVIQLNWLANGYELMVLYELIFENKKKLAEEAGTSRSEESIELLALLLDERVEV